MDLTSFIMGLLPSIIAGMVAFYWQRRQKRHDAKVEARAVIRKKEMQLTMEMQLANLKLTVGTALAVKHGKANGEMEEGLEACDVVKKKYLTFINEQAAEHITD